MAREHCRRDTCSVTTLGAVERKCGAGPGQAGGRSMHMRLICVPVTGLVFERATVVPACR